MPWETEAEERIYQQAVRRHLKVPHIARKLEARPGVTEAAVSAAMDREENISYALAPCKGPHRRYRRVAVRLAAVPDRRDDVADGAAWDWWAP